MNEEKVKYWEKRKAQRMFEYMQSAEETSNIISKVYLKASNYLIHERDIVFDRYKEKHHLSELEARNLLNQIHDKDTINELKELLRQAKTKDKAELLKRLESPTYASRIKRLEDKLAEVDILAKNIYGLEKKQSSKHYKCLIKDSYYKSIYDIQQDNGLAFSFSKLSEKQIDHVLKSKWSGVNYSSRIWSNTNELARNVKEELLLNLMTGRSNEEAAKAIQGCFNTGMMEARRLIRTESCYIVNEMEAQSFEECGIDKYMYVATLDKKTSKECREHDSKVYLVKNRKAGVNFPPLHPWCRSTTIAYLGDDILADMERRARNDDTGETYTVPATTSYQEWFDGLVEKDGKLRFDLDLQLFGSDDLTDVQKGALLRYISSGSYTLNEKLREDFEITDAEKQWIKNLDEALDKMPTYEGEVIRDLYFMYKEDIDAFLENHKVGNYVNYKQYLSSTCMKVYNDNADIRIHIFSKHGKDIRKFNEKEQEILFHRNSAFLVKDVKYDNKRFIIYLEEQA